MSDPKPEITGSLPDFTPEAAMRRYLEILAHPGRTVADDMQLEAAVFIGPLLFPDQEDNQLTELISLGRAQTSIGAGSDERANALQHRYIAATKEVLVMLADNPGIPFDVIGDLTRQTVKAINGIQGVRRLAATHQQELEHVFGGMVSEGDVSQRARAGEIMKVLVPEKQPGRLRRAAQAIGRTAIIKRRPSSPPEPPS